MIEAFATIILVIIVLFLLTFVIAGLIIAVFGGAFVVYGIIAAVMAWARAMFN